MHIVVPAGGIGGARFLRGLLATVPPDSDESLEVTVIGNTGDDITLFGLRVCPDLDTVMYTLGGGIHEEQGWGRADETFAVKDELAAYGVGPAWFGLGDRDFATHLVRTQMLDAGYPLSAGHRGAVRRRWRTRGAAAADERRPGRDARRDRRPGGTGDRLAGRRSTSRSTGCGCTQRPARTRSWPSAPQTRSPAPGVLEAIADRRPGPAAAVQPGREHRHVLAVPGIRDALVSSRRAGRRALADRRRRPGARHGRPGARRDRRRDVRRRGRAALRPAR